MYISPITVLYALNLHCIVCQLYLNETRSEKKKKHLGTTIVPEYGRPYFSFFFNMSPNFVWMMDNVILINI